MSRRENRNNKYSPELKLAAVEAYLRGEGSLRDISKQFEIKDKKSLRQWISYYKSHKEFKRPSAARGGLYMTKAKKTTQPERADIVAFCPGHGKDYLLTVEQYGVSYRQIYS